VPPEHAPVDEDHYVLRDVSAQVLLDDLLKVLALPPLRDGQMVFEHLLRGSTAELLHGRLLSVQRD